MTDYYFASYSSERLVEIFSPPTVAPAYRAQAVPLNIVQPVQGRAAVPATEDMPEQPACGDPDKWYCLVRIDAQIVAPEDIEIVNPEIGSKICGTWS